MVLILIGLGLDIEDLSMYGIKSINDCKKIYILASKYHPYNKKELEDYLSRKLIIIPWDFFYEKIDEIAFESREDAKDNEIGLCMPGNPFCDDLYPKIKSSCDKQRVELKIVYNLSYLNAMGNTGIQLYKFGESLLMDNCSEDELERSVKIIHSNLERKLNSLIVFNKEVPNLYSQLMKRLSDSGSEDKEPSLAPKIVLLLYNKAKGRYFAYGSLHDMVDVPEDNVEALSVCFDFDCVEEEYIRKMKIYQDTQRENERKGNFCIIGLGLCKVEHITVRGKRLIEQSGKVFLEAYTSCLLEGKEGLEEYFGKEVIAADREMVEQDSHKILDCLKDGDVAFLVVGDPFGATTHTDIILRSIEEAKSVIFANNASIMNATGVSGLKPARFGNVISIPFWRDNYKPDSFLDKILFNMEMGLHTLCLLDIQVKEQSFENLARGRKIYEKPRFMSVGVAASQLLESIDKRQQNGESIKLNENTKTVTLGRVGRDDEVVGCYLLGKLPDMDHGPPLQSLIIVGELDEDEKASIKLNPV